MERCEPKRRENKDRRDEWRGGAREKRDRRDEWRRVSQREERQGRRVETGELERKEIEEMIGEGGAKEKRDRRDEWRWGSQKEERQKR